MLTQSGKVGAKTLPWEITNPTASPVSGSLQGRYDDQVYTSSNDGAEGETNKMGYDLKVSASKAEYEAIMAVLKEVNFNKTKAAEILKIDRKTLYNKIKGYGELNG